MNKIEKKILKVIQEIFPVSSNPYKILADKFGLTEQNFFNIIKNLKEKKLIRRIGASIDSHKLGLCSTLIGMKVPPKKLNIVKEIVNKIPGVTHNYLRKGEYNVWFTLTSVSNKKNSYILKQIKYKTGIKDILDLPAIKIFKINAKFKI